MTAVYSIRECVHQGKIHTEENVLQNTNIITIDGMTFTCLCTYYLPCSVTIPIALLQW